MIHMIRQISIGSIFQNGDSPVMACLYGITYDHVPVWKLMSMIGNLSKLFSKDFMESIKKDLQHLILFRT